MSDSAHSAVFLDSDQVIPIHFDSHTHADDKSILLSIVTPAYNEEANIRRFYTEVSAVLNTLDVNWEIIFVNDGSKDDSAELMRQLNKEDSRCKSVIFARNFGFQIAISAGLRAASGQAVVVMDADLQHPPQLIPLMLEKWKEGFHVVNTLRQGYGKDVSFFKKFTSAAFYKVMNLVSETPIEAGACDFRLMDRTVVEILNHLPEQTPFFRALVRWLGFRQTSIPCSINARQAGIPAFTIKKMLTLAIDGMISFSTKPLRWIMYLGFFVTAMVIPYGIWAIIDHFIFDATVPGWTSLIVINLLLGGTMLVSLGVIGEYIGRIYNQVKGRPLFTVQQQYGIEKNIVNQTVVGHAWLDRPENAAEIKPEEKIKSKTA